MYRGRKTFFCFRLNEQFRRIKKQRTLLRLPGYWFLSFSGPRTRRSPPPNVVSSPSSPLPAPNQQPSQKSRLRHSPYSGATTWYAPSRNSAGCSSISMASFIATGYNSSLNCQPRRLEVASRRQIPHWAPASLTTSEWNMPAVNFEMQKPGWSLPRDSRSGSSRAIVGQLTASTAAKARGRNPTSFWHHIPSTFLFQFFTKVNEWKVKQYGLKFADGWVTILSLRQ